MTVKFRPHRGQLADAMAEMQEFETRAELVAYIKKTLDPYGAEPMPLEEYDKGLDISYYGEDVRIQWGTYIVILEGYGVFGFTDGPFPET